MSQILAVRTEDGVVVATDSKAILFLGDKRYTLTVEKLFKINSSLGIITLGLTYGIEMVRDFLDYLRKEGIKEFGDVCGVANTFFSSQFSKELKRAPHHIKDLYKRLYIMIFGRSISDYRITLFSTENYELPFLEQKIESVVTIPRLPIFEIKIKKLAKELSLFDLASYMLNYLRSCDNEDIGPPFYGAIVTDKGFFWIS